MNQGKNQGVGNNYPLPHHMEERSVGDGAMPQGTVQPLKFHPAGEQGQPGQGGASSGRPGPSGAPALARVLDRRLPEGVEVLALSPIIQMGKCSGLRGLGKSSTGCFWAHYFYPSFWAAHNKDV